MAVQETSFDEVATAADTIVRNGGQATLDTLRGALGDAASAAAIHRHLATWRASRATPAEAPPAQLPDALIDALGSWARQYAEQAGVGARDALAQSESDMQPLLESITRLESERDQALETVDEQAERIERLTAELRNARLVATDALVGKAKDHLAIEGKDSQLADLRQQIARNVTATAALSDARLAAEMELVGAVTARDNFAAEIQDLRAQLDKRAGRGG